MKKYIFFLFSLLNLFFSVEAQKVTVIARIDSTSIWIGNQTRLSFEITQQKDLKVLSPTFSDNITNGLELVEKIPSDTTLSNSDLHVVESYLVTAFKDTTLEIPAFPFIVENDTFWSEPLSLKVIQPFHIDTASASLAPLKSQFEPPFNWKQFWLIVLGGILILVLLVLIIYFIVKLYKTKKPLLEIKKVTQIPVHIQTLEILDNMKQQKSWTSLTSKEYYSQLTDVIRTYIEGIYDIPSKEMTSEEVLFYLKQICFDNPKALSILQELLALADLVKFAKWDVEDVSKLNSLEGAYEFVLLTKPDETALERETEEVKEDIEFGTSNK